MILRPKTSQHQHGTLAGAAAAAASGAAAGLLESEIRRMIALYLADEG